MKVQQAPGGPGIVGAGVRGFEVRVSFSPQEYDVVAGVAGRQGWTVGGWVGAVVECVERLGPAPAALGIDELAWWRCTDRAESLRFAGEWLGDLGVGPPADELAQVAGRLEKVCRARASGMRGRVAADNAAAALSAELRATHMGPGVRPRGGAQRARVRVMLTERTRGIVAEGAGRHGWSVGEWVGTVAAAAAGWLVRGELREAELVQPFLTQLAAPGVPLAGQAQLGGAAGRLIGLTRLAARAVAEVRTAEAGLLGVATRCERAREGMPSGDAGAVEAVLGWPGQLAVDVRPDRDDEAIQEPRGVGI